MNFHFVRTLLLFAFLTGSSLATGIVWANIAYAESESAATLAEFQTKLEAAMHTRPASYSINYSAGGLTKKNLTAILDSIYDADNYLHYSTKTYGYSMTSDKSSASVDFSFTYWETTEQSEAVTAKVKEILSQIITGGMNDFQKQKAINDWIVANLAYDTSLAQHSAYAGLFGSKKTVCQGYALLAYRMLSEAGLPNQILEGMAGGQLHTWNLVKLDGNWYHLDTTWNDPVPDKEDQISYGYYNLNDAQIKTNHSWKKKYPAATVDFTTTLADKQSTDSANAAFYLDLQQSLELQYLQNEYTASSPAELAAHIKETLAANQPSFTVRYTAKRSIANDLKSAIKDFGNISRYSYGSPDFTRTSSSADALLTVNLTYGDPIAVTGLALNTDSELLNIGGTVALIPSVQPANASSKGINWSSSDNAIATVSAKGIVTGKTAGTAIIMATTVDGDITAIAEITVLQPVTRITLTKTALTLKVGDPDFLLTAAIAPSNASVKTVTWSSSNPGIATVDDSGNVHAVSTGKATITVKSTNGRSTSTTVTVAK
jgi:transglutaminase/protease-like cytokinesis protein 3